MFEEASKNPQSILWIETAQNQGKLTILTPEERYFNQVQKVAKKSGDLGALSHTDVSVIALTQCLRDENTDLKVLLLSGDYSVQNVCSFMNPPLQSTSFSKSGITKSIIWETYCPHCYRGYTPDLLGSKCPECDVELKRRRSRKKV